MQHPALLLALVGIVIVAGVSIAGYYLGQLAEQPATETGSPSPTPEESPTPEISPSPSPSPSVSPTPSPTPSPRPSPLPTAPAMRPRPSPAPVVRGTSTFPSSLPTFSEASAQPVRVSFVSLPERVHSGDSFTVEWRVDGPPGTSGTKTTLKVSYAVSSASGTARSSSSSTTEHSLGSFTIPSTFSTKLSYGGTPGTIQLTASADVGGTTVTTTGSIELVN